MPATAESNIETPSTVREIAVAFFFGLAALLVVLADLTLPIVGTGVVTDPREIFTTVGSALTGPVGGFIIGILAGIREPGIPAASLVAHIAGGVWMGLAYKKLVHGRLEIPWLLVGWALLVVLYYYVFAVPGFVIGQSLFYPADYVAAYGDGAPLVAAYAKLGEGVLPEVASTVIITTLVLLALPKLHRRPLW